MTLERYFENELIFNRAFDNMQNGNFDEAIQGFEAVLNEQPAHHQSHGNLGLIHGMLGDKKSALIHLDKALEIDPGYEVASINRPIVEKLKEGEKLNKQMQTVNYSATGIQPV